MKHHKLRHTSYVSVLPDLLSDHSSPSSSLFWGSAISGARGWGSYRGRVTGGEVEKLFSTKLREIVSLVTAIRTEVIVFMLLRFSFLSILIFLVWLPKDLH